MFILFIHQGMQNREYYGIILSQDVLQYDYTEPKSSW